MRRALKTSLTPTNGAYKDEFDAGARSRDRQGQRQLSGNGEYGTQEPTDPKEPFDATRRARSHTETRQRLT